VGDVLAVLTLLDHGADEERGDLVHGGEVVLIEREDEEAVVGLGPLDEKSALVGQEIDVRRGRIPDNLRLLRAILWISGSSRSTCIVGPGARGR